MKFRKRPVVIEAEQLTWGNWNRICEFVPRPWFVRGCYLGENMEETQDPIGRLGLIIKTLESNEFIAQEGDWIIRGVDGEFYACKEAIFHKTYEPVDNNKPIEHMCNTCKWDFPSCNGTNIVWGIDCDVTTIGTKEADAVVCCNSYTEKVLKADELIVVLEIIDWGVCIGGEHLSGTIKGYKNGDYCSVKVKHPLSRSEALHLNKKEECSALCRHKLGESSGRFESEKDLIEAARKIWKFEFPNARALMKGYGSTADPQEVLCADRKFKTTVNRMWRQMEAVGWYEGDEALCFKISDEYQRFLKEWSKSP